MAFDLASISAEPTMNPPRVFLIGTEKVGKTTFASQWPNAVFIPVKGERGLDGIACSKFPFVENYTDLVDALRSLDSDQHNFQTVVLDSVSTLEPVIWDRVCKRCGADSIEQVHKGYGKGYNEALKEWREVTDLLDRLRDRGMASILIGHIKVKGFNDPLEEPYDVYLPDINDKASSAIMRWADAVWFANRKARVERKDKDDKARIKDVNGAEPRLFTQKRAAHPGGGRHVYGRISYELPLNYDAVMAEVSAKMDVAA